MMAGLLDDFPQAAAPAPISKSDMFRARLRDIGAAGQGNPGGAQAALRQQQQAQQQAAAMRQQAMAAAKQLFPGNGQLQLLASAKPEAFFATIQEYSKPQKLGQGEKLSTMGGAADVYNPKTGFEGDNPYVLGEDGNATYGAPRPMTYTETETGANNQRIDERQNEQAAEVARHNRASEGAAYGNLGVARGNLDLSRQRLNGSGGGGLEGMTTEQLIALAKSLK